MKGTPTLSPSSASSPPPQSPPPPTVNTSLLPSYSTARVRTLPRVERTHLRWARALALLSFLFSLGALLYGIVASPDLGRIAKQHKHAFTPNGWLALAHLVVHLVFQALWVNQLFQFDEANFYSLDALPSVPAYALGGLFFLGWTLSFAWAKFLLATVAATSYLLAHAFALARLPIPTRSSLNTHVVIKGGCALGITGVLLSGADWLEISAPPSVLVEALAMTVIGLVTLINDPIFGAGLAYDLFAVYITQPKPWRGEVMWMAIGVTAVVLVKSLVFRVY